MTSMTYFGSDTLKKDHEHKITKEQKEQIIAEAKEKA